MGMDRGTCLGVDGRLASQGSVWTAARRMVRERTERWRGRPVPGSPAAAGPGGRQCRRGRGGPVPRRRPAAGSGSAVPPRNPPARNAAPRARGAAEGPARGGGGGSGASDPPPSGSGGGMGKKRGAGLGRCLQRQRGLERRGTASWVRRRGWGWRREAGESRESPG